MAELSYVVSILAILVGSSAASLQVLLASEPSPSLRTSFEIETLPWSVFVQSGEQICSGIIIHKDWVLVLQACELHNAHGSDIKVSAGGESPENATQILSAEIHQMPDLMEGGMTLLHLKDSLVFGETVQPARIPSGATGNLNKFYGLASGFAHEGNTIQLMGFDVTLYTETDLCPDSESLCASPLLDWPQSNSSLAGTEFLGTPYYYDEEKGYFYLCIIGGRKSELGNNFTSYYPLLNILPSIQSELGLTVVPTPEGTICGTLE